MIEIHWSWIAFALISMAFIFGIWKVAQDEDIPLLTPVLLICYIAFILIWGGIFWW